MLNAISSSLSTLGLMAAGAFTSSAASRTAPLSAGSGFSAETFREGRTLSGAPRGLFDPKWSSALFLSLCVGIAGCGGDNETINPAPATCRPAGDAGSEGGASGTGGAGGAETDALPICPDNPGPPDYYDPNSPGCSDEYCPSGDPTNP